MNHYCDIREEAIKIETKYKQLQSQSLIGLEKWIQKVYTSKNPNLFEIDEIINEYITDYNKNFNKYFVKNELEKVFDKKIYPHSQRGLKNNQSISPLKKKLLLSIEYPTERGYKFSYLYELNNITILSIRRMTFEFYTKRPKQIVQLKVNINNNENLHCIIALDRSVNHPLIRKFNDIE